MNLQIRGKPTGRGGAHGADGVAQGKPRQAGTDGHDAKGGLAVLGCDHRPRRPAGAGGGGGLRSIVSGVGGAETRRPEGCPIGAADHRHEWGLVTSGKLPGKRLDLCGLGLGRD